MQLGILIRSKKLLGLAGARILPVLQEMDSLSMYSSNQREMALPLSIAEGIKFVKQEFYDGDSSNYALTNGFYLTFVGEYLKPRDDQSPKSNLSKLLSSFIDTSRSFTRMSVNIADVGTVQLPQILEGIRNRIDQLKVTLTGSTITFMEGSRFIINELIESLLGAFLLICISMLYLFKSFRVLICSLIPHVIPLIVTAGIMGWVGVSLKPSTGLIFSVALGIATDITIRFQVNYKQELPGNYNADKNNFRTNKSHGLEHSLYFISVNSWIYYFLFKRFWWHTIFGLAYLHHFVYCHVNQFDFTTCFINIIPIKKGQKLIVTKGFKGIFCSFKTFRAAFFNYKLSCPL